jgi:hypothetical protein
VEHLDRMMRHHDGNLIIDVLARSDQLLRFEE